MFTELTRRRAVALSIVLPAIVGLVACSHKASGASSSQTAPSGQPGSTSTPGASASSSSSASGSKTKTPNSTSLSVVPSLPEKTLPPVPLTAVANFGGGVSIKVTQIANQTSSDTGPGTIKGQAAVAFTLQLRNESKTTVSVNTVNVTAGYGAGTPASPVNLSSNPPFKGQVKPGGMATGVYAFAIPTTDRSHVSLTLWYAQGKPTVVFSGSAA